MISRKLNFSNRLLAWAPLLLVLVGIIVGFGIYFLEKNTIEKIKKNQYQILSKQLYSSLKQSVSSLILISSISHSDANKNNQQQIDRIKNSYDLFDRNAWLVQIGLFELSTVNNQHEVKKLWLSDKPSHVIDDMVKRESAPDEWTAIVNHSRHRLLSILPENRPEQSLPTLVANITISSGQNDLPSASQKETVLIALLSAQYWKTQSAEKLPTWIEINYQPTALWQQKNPELSAKMIQAGQFKQGKLEPLQSITELLPIKLNSSQITANEQLIARIVNQDIDLVFTTKLFINEIELPITEFEWLWEILFLYLIVAISFWLYIRRVVGETHRLRQAVADAAQKITKSNTKITQRNTHLAAIVNTSMDAIISASSKGIVQSFNPAAERIFGWVANEVIGQNLTMLMPEPYHSEHDGYLANYFATGIKKVIGFERKVKGKHKHGRVFDIRLAVLESIIDDQPVYIGYISDLSENESLKFELSTFFDLSLDLFCLAGFDGYFKQLNKAWTTTLGYELNELLAMSYEKLIHPDDREATMAEVKKLADPNYKMVEFNNRYLTKQGEYRWFCWNALPNNTGDMVYASGRDITGQKQQQIQMQLANDRMALASDKLQQLDGLKSMFIATMSHELRTPLNSIIGFSSVLLQGLSGELNEKQQDHLRRVNNASKHLLDMISDIIDVSKIEAERFDSINEQFDVRDVVGDVVESIAEQAKKYGIALNIEALGSVILTTDKRRIKQVILNLLSNAVKYSLKGEIKIFVNSVDQDIEIVVQDQGIGISDNNLEELFMPFSRFERLKMERSGTGLGLYLTKKIVENILMGQIMVHSVVDEGSKFSVVIPTVRPWQEHKGSEYEETVNGVNYRG